MTGTATIRGSLEFGFATGRVRACETRLLGRSHLERLLDADSLGEQVRILSESVYGGYLDDVSEIADVELALRRASVDLLDRFLESANLPVHVVRFLRAFEDYNELRGLLKAEALGLAPDVFLGGLGTVNAEKFAAGRLPAYLASVLSVVRGKALLDDETLALDRIDQVVDAEMYRALFRQAKAAKSGFLNKMAGIMVDVANVKALVRTKVRGLPSDTLAVSFIAGGSLTQVSLAGVYRYSAEEAAAYMTGFGVFSKVDPEALFDPARFDVVADTVIARHAREEAMLVAVGPEPVFAYFFLRRVEIAIVRTLLCGMIAGVPRELLRARLRDVTR